MFCCETRLSGCMGTSTPSGSQHFILSREEVVTFLAECPSHRVVKRTGILNFFCFPLSPPLPLMRVKLGIKNFHPHMSFHCVSSVSADQLTRSSVCVLSHLTYFIPLALNSVTVLSNLSSFTSCGKTSTF